MNQAILDALLAVFEKDGTPVIYYIVTAEGKHRLSPVTIESIDALLNCTIKAVDAGSIIPSAIHAAKLYETVDDALDAFDAKAMDERDIAVRDRNTWGK